MCVHRYMCSVILDWTIKLKLVGIGYATVYNLSYFCDNANIWRIKVYKRSHPFIKCQKFATLPFLCWNYQIWSNLNKFVIIWGVPKWGTRKCFFKWCPPPVAPTAFNECVGPKVYKIPFNTWTLSHLENGRNTISRLYMHANVSAAYCCSRTHILLWANNSLHVSVLPKLKYVDIVVVVRVLSRELTIACVFQFCLNWNTWWHQVRSQSGIKFIHLAVTQLLHFAFGPTYYRHYQFRACLNYTFQVYIKIVMKRGTFCEDIIIGIKAGQTLRIHICQFLMLFIIFCSGENIFLM